MELDSKGPDNLRPAEVMVYGIENSPLAVDFSVVHPLQPSADLAEVRHEKWHGEFQGSRADAGASVGRSDLS